MENYNNKLKELKDIETIVFKKFSLKKYEKFILEWNPIFLMFHKQIQISDEQMIISGTKIINDEIKYFKKKYKL